MYIKIRLDRPLNGSEIINAVQKVISGNDGSKFENSILFLEDKMKYYRIGQNSLTPYQDLVVGIPAGLNNDIVLSPDEVYEELYFHHFQFEGRKRSIGYSAESCINYISDFANKINNELKNKI